MPSAQDPFYVVREEIQDSIDKLLSTFQKWEHTAHEPGEQARLEKELLAGCESIEWQMDELAKAISVAARDPTWYGIDEDELENRRRWTSNARNQVRTVKKVVEAGRQSNATGTASASERHRELMRIPAAHQADKSNQYSAQHDDFISSESDRQLLLIKRQDEELDDLSASVQWIGHVGLTIHDELRAQTQKISHYFLPVIQNRRRPAEVVMFTRLSEVLTVISAVLLCSGFSTISAATITPGSNLLASNPNQTWGSPKNIFSFGLIPVQPPTSPPSFVAAISYAGGAPIIWSAGNGATVDSQGSLRFLSTGGLQLVNGSGTVVWDTGTSNKGVSSAELNDAGNFVLSNGSGPVWSTFDNPTDTIVPLQNFTVNKVLRSGNYSFSLLRAGNLTLKWNGSIVYWNQGLNSTVNSTVNATLLSPVLSLQSIGILKLDDPMLPSSATMAYSSDYAESSDILRVLKLDNDGNLRIYSSPKGSGTTTERWAAVKDQCEVFGYCGNMGICGYNDSSPVCSCPSQNFDPVDPNDSRKGCKRKIEIKDCPGSATMLQLNHAQFLTYPPESNPNTDIFFIGITACQGNCLGGSACVASTSLSDGTGLCYLKNENFVSGYQNPSLPSTSFVKVCGPAIPNAPPSLQEADKSNRRKVRAWIVVLVVVGTLLGMLIFEGGLWFWFCRKNPKFGALSAQYALLEYASGAPVQFSYRELQRSTKGFKDKLGTGGFGAVYRGVLSNKTVVAVKQLEGIEQGERQFRMEVATISSTHHLNLVRLIGFCSEGRHRLLVYEFMRNGSLDNFLFPAEQSGKLLNWEQRFSIALGTAKGITYLHEECRDCIVHCDIKPENILLDDNYVAKVSDFGLAKLINPKDHRNRTLISVRGTRGYLAPEWLANLPITTKSDVYSFGMVLLEIVSGRRNFDLSEDTNRKKYSVWAYEEFEKGNFTAIMDRRLTDQVVDIEEIKRAIQVSFWCIQEQPSQRPTIGKVVQMLEGVVEIEMPPPPKVSSEVSMSGTSFMISSNTSGLSTATVSVHALSSSSSMQPAGASSLVSGRNTEKASSSLLQDP